MTCKPKVGLQRRYTVEILCVSSSVKPCLELGADLFGFIPF